MYMYIDVQMSTQWVDAVHGFMHTKVRYVAFGFVIA